MRMLQNTSSSEDQTIEKARDFGDTLEELLDILENLDEKLLDYEIIIQEKDQIIAEQKEEIRLLELRVSELESSL